ncbi:MAG: 1-acyl-sn-glycerol-3-phosphate acyltransferase [Dehalococcoidia bacterium]|nr:1-acyl-sn-glycerol-3-phosphate acyltransferase [Dehalococcoidia bacterium]
MRARLALLIYAACVALTRLIVHVFTRLEVVGRERVPAEGALIFVANHVHLLDPPLVAACVDRRVHPMAKRELFEIPLIGWFFHAYGAFPVRRFSADMGALRVARNILRNGEAVLMFPEGTRGIRQGAATELRPARPGSAVVAQMSHAPVVPVAITGSNVALPGVFIAWIFGRRPHVRVEFGEPLVIAEPSSGGDSPEVATDRMMRRIAAMLPESHRGAYGAASEGTVVVLRETRERSARPSPAERDDEATPPG